MLENACHSQLLAEAAAANGIPKKIISHEVAQYTAEFAQNPVSATKPKATIGLVLISYSTTSILSFSRSMSCLLRRPTEDSSSKGAPVSSINRLFQNRHRVPNIVTL